MIKLSQAHCQSISQNRALLMKLYQTQMPLKIAYQMKKILEQVGNAAKRIDEKQYSLQVEAAKEYGVLDEKGQPTTTPEGDLMLKDPDSRAAVNKHIFMGLTPELKREIQINQEPLDFSGSKLELTLEEIHLLGPILANDPTSTVEGDASA